MSAIIPISTNPVTVKSTVNATSQSPPNTNVLSSKEVVLKAIPREIHFQSSSGESSTEQTEENDEVLLVEAPFMFNKIDNTLPQTEPTLEEKEVHQVAPLVDREESIVCIDSVSSSFYGDSFDRLDDHPAKEDEDHVFQEFKEDNVEGINEELGELKDCCAEEELKATEIRASYSEGEKYDENEIKGSKPKVEEDVNVETTAEVTITKPVEISKEDIVEECSLEKYKHKIVICLLVVTAITLTFLFKKRGK